MSQLTDTEIFIWSKIFDEYMDLAKKGGLRGAADLIYDNFCTDDGFIDFRCWLIAQGKDTYLQALSNPDDLADIEQIQTFIADVRQMEDNQKSVFRSKELPRYEVFGYSASDAYKEKHTNNSKADYYEDRKGYILSNAEKQSIYSDIHYAEYIETDINKIGGIGGVAYDALYPNLGKELHRMYTKAISQDDYDIDSGIGEVNYYEYHKWKEFNSITFTDMRNYTDFDHSLFNNCTFKTVDISHSNFGFCKLTNCKFEGVNLQDSSFVGAHITDTKFNSCFLDDVNFMSANFKDSIIDKATLDKANFISAKMDNMQFKDCLTTVIYNFDLVSIIKAGATSDEITKIKQEMYKALNIDSYGYLIKPTKKSVKEQLDTHSKNKQGKENKQKPKKNTNYER